MGASASIGDWLKGIRHTLRPGPAGRGRLRSVAVLIITGLVVAILPNAFFAGPVGTLVVVSTILICCWYSGPFLALVIPLHVAATMWLFKSPRIWATPSSEELVALVLMAGVACLTGLTGQYRRRLKSETRRHKAKILEQSRALSLARILFRDMDGRITTWTEGAEELFGWTSREANGQLIQELLQTQFPKPLEEIRRELLLNCQWQGAVRQRCKDGRELIVATHWIL